MILGDDDRLQSNAIDILEETLKGLDPSICAVKFDSSLFGNQQDLTCRGLDEYLQSIPKRQRADAFNNLCLISNWIFRRVPYLRHLSTAYLGYPTKIPHLLPALRACHKEFLKIHFSSLQPVIHGSGDEGWPKAASWYEMVVSLSTFSGFLDTTNRRALLKMVLHGDWRRYPTKVLRVQQFFSPQLSEIRAWRIHSVLAMLSPIYLLVLILLSPMLLIPSSLWPDLITRRLGPTGSFERW
jgi:hypothetical protein